jgi:1-acyl-sn-glycerol-3-phosphate acyltransferase
MPAGDGGSFLSRAVYRAKVVYLNATFWPIALIVSLIFGLIAIPYVYLFDLIGRNRRRTMWLIRRTISHYGATIFRLGWPLVTIEYIDQEPGVQGPVVFVCNHRAASDAFLMAVLPYECIQIMNIWPGKIPIIGPLARLAGYLSVRELPFDDYIEKGTKVLQAGACVIAFPEGTRSGSRQLGQFHGSAFRLAMHNKVTIVPLAIEGNENVPPRGSMCLHPSRIVITKLPAVTAGQYADMTPYRLKTLVRERIGAYLDAQPA